jgi:propionyl-CoA carboxylase alpha chain
VEHPVTELVTGIDLVREQLRVAAGEPLDFDQEDIEFDGAAIEVRLYAEDPANDFLPATGTLAAYTPAEEPEVRWDSGVEQGSVVGTDFDPMLAKVIAWAPTRREAAGRLALALARTHLGGVVTNRDFLVNVLRTPAFLDGDTTTDFIDRIGPARVRASTAAEVARAAQLAALWIQGVNRASAPVLATIPSGWRNARLPDQQIVFEHGGDEVVVRYRSLRDGRFHVSCDAESGGAEARIHAWGPDGIDAEIGGHRSRAEITRSGEQMIVQTANGDIVLGERPRFKLPGSDEEEGSFVARMPGKVIQLRVAVGDAVAAGDTVLVLEAMKMEHPMRAAEDGIVMAVHVALGDQVEAGTLLLVVESAAAAEADTEE